MRKRYRSVLAGMLGVSMILGAVPAGASDGMEEAPDQAEEMVLEDDEAVVDEDVSDLDDEGFVDAAALESVFNEQEEDETESAWDDVVGLIEDEDVEPANIEMAAGTSYTNMQLNQRYTISKESCFAVTVPAGAVYTAMTECFGNDCTPDISFYEDADFTNEIEYENWDFKYDYYAGENYKIVFDRSGESQAKTYYIKIYGAYSAAEYAFDFGVYDQASLLDWSKVELYLKSTPESHVVYCYMEAGNKVELRIEKTIPSDSNLSDAEITYQWKMLPIDEDRETVEYIAGATGSTYTFTAPKSITPYDENEKYQPFHVACNVTITKNGHSMTLTESKYIDVYEKIEKHNSIGTALLAEPWHEDEEYEYFASETAVTGAGEASYFKVIPTKSGAYIFSKANMYGSPMPYKLYDETGRDITGRVYKEDVYSKREDGSSEYSFTREFINLDAGHAYYVAITNSYTVPMELQGTFQLFKNKKVVDQQHTHSYGKWTVTVQPTAVSEGRKVRSCTMGDDTQTRVIPRLTPFVEMNVKSGAAVPLKIRQSTDAIKVTGLQKGDSVASWKSSNTKVASVTSTGKITGKKKGTATITVSTVAGAVYQFKVKVQNTEVKTKKLSVAAKKVTLKKGQTFDLKTTVSPITTKQKVTYTLSRKGIVTVKKGVIKAKKKGTVNITVTSGGKKKTVKVTVQ